MMTEKQYDNLHNEGGEGYNPIRAKAEADAIQAAPARSADCIIRKLNALDMGDHRNVTIRAALKAELKANYPEDYDDIYGGEE